MVEEGSGENGKPRFKETDDIKFIPSDKTRFAFMASSTSEVLLGELIQHIVIYLVSGSKLLLT